jgi:hypothetical protein
MSSILLDEIGQASRVHITDRHHFEVPGGEPGHMKSRVFREQLGYRLVLQVGQVCAVEPCVAGQPIWKIEEETSPSRIAWVIQVPGRIN